jgi:hypothetical protein
MREFTVTGALIQSSKQELLVPTTLCKELAIWLETPAGKIKF